MAGHGLAVDSKDALHGSCGPLAYYRKRTHYAQANPQTCQRASRALPHKGRSLGITSGPAVNACDTIKHHTPFFSHWQEFSLTAPAPVLRPGAKTATLRIPSSCSLITDFHVKPGNEVLLSAHSRVRMIRNKLPPATLGHRGLVGRKKGPPSEGEVGLAWPRE